MYMDLSNNSFNFKNSGISNLKYNSILNDILNRDEVIDVTHSLPMNSISVHLDPERKYNSYSIYNLPINVIKINELDGEDVLTVQLRTTKLLCSDSRKDEIFHAEYSDESMAYLKAQLDLFDNIEETTLVRKNDEIRTMCATNYSTQDTYLLNDLLSYTGHTISNFNFNNGSIEAISIRFDESAEFTDDLVNAIRESKYRMISNEKFYNSEVQLSCGHTGKANILMISGIPDNINNNDFEEVTIDGDIFYRIDLKDINKFESEPDPARNDVNLNNNKDSSGTIKKGYVCEICDSISTPKDKSTLTDIFSPNVEMKTKNIHIPDTNACYTFKIYNHAYKSL